MSDARTIGHWVRWRRRPLVPVLKAMKAAELSRDQRSRAIDYVTLARAWWRLKSRDIYRDRRKDRHPHVHRLTYGHAMRIYADD